MYVCMYRFFCVHAYIWMYYHNCNLTSSAPQMTCPVCMYACMCLFMYVLEYESLFTTGSAQYQHFLYFKNIHMRTCTCFMWICMYTNAPPLPSSLPSLSWQHLHLSLTRALSVLLPPVLVSPFSPHRLPPWWSVSYPPQKYCSRCEGGVWRRWTVLSVQ